jgi:hypothetical protein
MKPSQATEVATSSVPISFFEELLHCLGDDGDLINPLDNRLFAHTNNSVEHGQSGHRDLENHGGDESAFRAMGDLGPLFSLRNHHYAAKPLLEDRAEMIAESYGFTWKEQKATTIATASDDIQESWTAPCKNPDHESTHRPVSRSFKAADPPPQNLAVQHEKCDTSQRYDSAIDRAHRLLGTTKGCSRWHIRSAYLRMVREWHPDRLQLANEIVRRSNTRKMVDINAAYRLLGPELVQ